MLRKGRPFHPPANRESFKDLLIFEERLKQNAERLEKQRRKYQSFLVSLVAVILYLAYLVLVQPSIYSLVHYSNVACLLVAVTTLVLFFATGMYADKIDYAYRFVPQANRALRPFNIYLNTRHKSRFSFLLRPFRSSPSPPLSRVPSNPNPNPNPISNDEPPRPSLSRQTSASSVRSQTSFRSTTALHSATPSPSVSPSSSPPSSPRTTSSVPLPNPNPEPNPLAVPTTDGAVTRAATVPPPPRQPTAVPIPPIPPAQNPRGELIFSNRVTPSFREGYERYRGEWEKRRKETKRAELARQTPRWWNLWRWTTTTRATGNRIAGSGTGTGREETTSKTGDHAQGEEKNEKERGRSSRLGSISADSPRLNSRANSTERSTPRQEEARRGGGGEESTDSAATRIAAEASLSSSSPSSSLRDTSSTSLHPLAPLDSDDPSFASTPPPQPYVHSSTRLSPSTAAVPQQTETTKQPQPRSHSRIRAESFSELLEFEAAANDDETELLGGGGEEIGPPGPPELRRTSSFR